MVEQQHIRRRDIITKLRKLGTPKTIIAKLQQSQVSAQQWQRYEKAYCGMNTKDRTAHYDVAKLAKTASDIIDDAAIRFNFRRNKASDAIDRDQQQIDAVEDAIDDEEGDQVLSILQHRYSMDTKNADYFGKPEKDIECPICFLPTVVVVAYPNGTGNAWCKERLGGCGWHLTADDHIKAFPKVDLNPYLGEPKWLRQLMGSASLASVAKQVIWKLDHQKKPLVPDRISDQWLAEKTGLSISTVTRAKTILRQEHGSWIQWWREFGGRSKWGYRPDRLLQAFLDMGEARKIPTAKMGTRQQLKKGGT